jgi:hypothetical protein
VGEVLADERARLLALPDPLPETDRVEPVQVDSQGFVRVDTNRYSVASVHAGHVRTLVVDDCSVRVLDAAVVLAEHSRSWGRRQTFEKPEHRAALVTERKAARDLKGRDRLRAVVPFFDRIVARWEVAGSSLGLRVTRAIKLLDLYGEAGCLAAATDIHARGLADVGALAVACEHQRKGRHRPVPLELVLPAHLDDTDVIPHDLGAYDE